MTRRKFGSIEKHTNAGSIYWRASYPTPDEYMAAQKRIRKISLTLQREKGKQKIG